MPWAWAVNGFGSVTGAVAATLLVVSIGFTWLIVAALGMYVAASYLVCRLAKASGRAGKDPCDSGHNGEIEQVSRM